MTEKQLSKIETKDETVSLSMIIYLVTELKVMAMYPKSERIARDKLYHKITQIENILLKLKDVNIELERDWWRE